MIKPKHSFSHNSFEINETFVDREEARKLYKEKLENNNRDYNILVYYGIGGIGKSKLCKELQRIHTSEYQDSLVFYLDLNATDDRNLGTGILKLVDSCNKKIDFRCFELAYALYYKKKYPGSAYGRDKESITDNTLIGIGLNIIGILDNGITSTTADIIERSIRAISNRTIDKSVKEELKKFDSYSIDVMEEMLPLFFQYDLSCYLMKHINTKVLIVLDTFEALNENILEPIHRKRNERWVQEMLSYFDSETFPNLLITIFGRESINWDDDWNDLLIQYHLVEFDQEYSREYLIKSGIKDNRIIDTLINNSKGYPLLLYLSLVTYANIVNRGDEPQETDFGSNKIEIIERFLYNLDKDTVELLRLISVPNYYNKDIFKMLVNAYNVSFPITEFEQFNKYSFISYDNNEEDYYIHNLLRNGILDNTSYELEKSIHLTLKDYYLDKIQSEMSYTKSFIEIIYHVSNALTSEEFATWLDSKIINDQTPLDIFKSLQKRGEQSVLLHMIEGLIGKYSINSIPIDLVNIYIDVVHLGGDYKTAVDICENYLSGFSDEEIFSNKQLLKMKIRQIHHSMFFLPVKELLNEGEHILDKVNREKFPEEYNELLFLLGGNLGVLSGDFEYAENWLNKSLDFSNEYGLYDYYHRTVRKLADICVFYKKYSGAMSYISPIISVDMKLSDIDSRYKIYLFSSLAELYRREGQLDKSEVCYKKIYEKSHEYHLLGWQAHSYLGMGLIEINRENYDVAKEYLESAYTVYNRINQMWGLINVETALVILERQSDGIINDDRIQKALEMSNKMNYSYNSKFLQKYKDDCEEYFELFFL